MSENEKKPLIPGDGAGRRSDHRYRYTLELYRYDETIPARYVHRDHVACDSFVIVAMTPRTDGANTTTSFGMTEKGPMEIDDLFNAWLGMTSSLAVHAMEPAQKKLVARTLAAALKDAGKVFEVHAKDAEFNTAFLLKSHAIAYASSLAVRHRVQASVVEVTR